MAKSVIEKIYGIVYLFQKDLSFMCSIGWFHIIYFKILSQKSLMCLKSGQDMRAGQKNYKKEDLCALNRVSLVLALSSPLLAELI